MIAIEAFSLVLLTQGNLPRALICNKVRRSFQSIGSVLKLRATFFFSSLENHRFCVVLN